MAAWHSACLAALGVESLRERSMWQARHPAPFIYLAAITLGGPGDAAEHRERVRELVASRPGPMAINDTWNALDLAGLGFERHTERWFARPAIATAEPTDPRVKRVRTPAGLATFEASQHRGFDTPELAAMGTFAVFAPRLLEDRNMHILAIEDGAGGVASSGMAYVAAGVVGIYSLATPADHRRQGLGEAVTRAALSVARWPAVLQPSAMGEALYRRLGFVPVGAVTNWIRRE
jgi:ribosomal protein S18 acetylase RimI-like enzyme